MIYEIDSFERHAVCVALNLAIERERIYQATYSDEVSNFDRNYLASLISVYEKFKCVQVL